MEEDADTLIAEMHRKARFRSLGESIHGTAAKLAVDLDRFSQTQAKAMRELKKQALSPDQMTSPTSASRLSSIY